MSWKSKRKIFKAFLIVSFFANLCCSSENLALDKDGTFIKPSLKVVDGDFETSTYCKDGKYELIVDLEAAHMIKTVKIAVFFRCDYQIDGVYSVEIQKNKTRTQSDYKCTNSHKNPISDEFQINDTFTCNSNEEYQFVAFRLEFECYTYIEEFQVFGSLSSNLALHKNAKIYQKALRSLDGDFKSPDYCEDGLCELIVDLGAAHIVETVQVACIFSCNKEYKDSVYSVDLRKYKINSDNEYTCTNLTQKIPIDYDLTINDTITCESKEAYQFVVFRPTLPCKQYLHEFQVFGSLAILPSTATTTASTTLTKHTLSKKLFPSNSAIDTASKEPAQYNSAINTVSKEQTNSLVNKVFQSNSAIGMKMDWSCYLAIFLAVLFSSISWVHCVYPHLSLIGTNQIGVVVSLKSIK